MNRLRFLVLLSIVFLTGCPAPPMCAKVIDTSASNLLISLASGNKCNYPVAIYSIEFLEPKERKVIWSISAPYESSYERLQLSTVTYGIIPIP